MSAARGDDRDEPIEEVVRDTVDQDSDVDVSEIVDEPAAGVLDDDRQDPPEPSEPG